MHRFVKLVILLPSLLPLLVACAPAAPRPHILWLTSEDNMPLLGCYGDPLATTPRLDALAAEGVRYTHAYANTPVCAPTRFTLLTGTYACAMGTEGMRSRHLRKDAAARSASNPGPLFEHVRRRPYCAVPRIRIGSG